MFSPCNPRPVGRKVYIGELGNNGSVQEIGNAFSLFGPLTNVWVARNPPGFAFVEFEDSRHAEEAIRALNGTILCGRRVRVEFARNSRSSYRPPPRNDSLEICYTCGEVGHYARDCIVELTDWLQLGDESGSNIESDDEAPYNYDDWFPPLESTMIFHSRNYSQTYPDDGRNSNSYQHRSNRPQEEQRNLALNIRPQDEHRNVAWRSRRRLLTRPQENHSNVDSEIRRNNRPEEEHRNATSQEQSNSVNDASGDVKCVICLDTVEDRMEYITCGHGFHAKCCNDWLSVNGACPVCRTRVSPGNGFVLEGFEGSIFQQMGYNYHIEVPW